MLFLGVDPALTSTGYALIDFNNNGRIHLVDKGVLTTSNSQKLSQRLSKIHKSMDALIKKAKPDAMILEKLYSHWRHPTTACLLGHARGVIILCGSQNSIAMFEYPTTHIKKSVTGRGNASNLQVKKMVEFFLGERIDSEHIVYASALVLAHINTIKHAGKN